jgi:hypothetical protein
VAVAVVSVSQSGKERGSTTSEPGPADAALKYYNTARVPTLQAIAGPFTFPRATLRVLPLLADTSRLQAFCEQYLGNVLYRFET